MHFPKKLILHGKDYLSQQFSSQIGEINCILFRNDVFMKVHSGFLKHCTYLFFKYLIGFKNIYFFHKNFRRTKKHQNNKCLTKHSQQLVFNTFCCQINYKEQKISHPYPVRFLICMYVLSHTEPRHLKTCKLNIAASATAI